MISSMSVPICNHFYVRRANNGRITSFWEGCPSFAPSFVRTPFTQWHKILSGNTRDTVLSYGENQKFLSHLGLEWYRDIMPGQRQTDGQTDGQNYHN